MSWVWKHSFRADTFPVVFFCGVAVAMAGGHLVRLARDPHTPFLKNEDQSRPWEQRNPSRYMTVKWTDVMENKKSQPSK